MSSRLHLPAHTLVRFELRSRDVEHVFEAAALGVSVTIPAGGEAAVDVSVGSPLRGQVREALTTDPNNAKMHAPLVVQEARVYRAWVRLRAERIERGGATLDEWGGKLFVRLGCRACHSLDGSDRASGPSLEGVWGRTVAGTTRLDDGRTVGQIIGAGRTFATAEDYLRAQILEPDRVHVAGFRPIAPTYRNTLKGSEVKALIAYLRTL